VDITSNYLSDEDYALATSTKLDEARKYNDELRGQLRIMEARNIRLSNDVTKLNEQVRHASELLTEHRQTRTAERKSQVITEQKERVQKVKNVKGRGHTNTEEGVVIREYNDPNSEINELLVLSGVKSSN
jgi:TolA-binding protein